MTTCRGCESLQRYVDELEQEIGGLELRIEGFREREQIRSKTVPAKTGTVTVVVPVRHPKPSEMGPDYQRPDSFTEWLLKQKGRSGSVGHLAYDAAGDDEWPDDDFGLPLRDYWEYMVEEGACGDALECLAVAWTEYQIYLGREDPIHIAD